MPTFESIHLHQQARESLSNVEPPIETPQALLSRDPVGLADIMGVPLNQITKLRSDVANALIKMEDHSEQAENIKAAIHRDVHTTNDDSAENGDSRTDDNAQDDGSQQQNDKISNADRNQRLILGSVTALDLCLYESLRGEHSRTLSTGSRRLDQLLSFPKELFSGAIKHPTRKRQRHSYENIDQGGIPFGYVTQVTGPPASGKTQMALIAALNHASNHTGVSVHYLASGVGHGSKRSLLKRLGQFCRGKPITSQVFNGVSLSTVSSGYEVLAALSAIETLHLQSQSDSQLEGESPATLIVLDSASGALSGDLYAAGDGGVGVWLAQQVASTLKRLARRYGAAVFVTNATVAGDGGISIKAAMGQSWKGSDLSLWMTIQDDVCDRSVHEDIAGLSVSTRKTVRATLERHPAKSYHGNNTEKRTVEFDISAAGITDVQET